MQNVVYFYFLLCLLKCDVIHYSPQWSRAQFPHLPLWWERGTLKTIALALIRCRNTKVTAQDVNEPWSIDIQERSWLASLSWTDLKNDVVWLASVRELGGQIILAKLKTWSEGSQEPMTKGKKMFWSFLYTFLTRQWQLSHLIHESIKNIRVSGMLTDSATATDTNLMKACDPEQNLAFLM